MGMEYKAFPAFGVKILDAVLGIVEHIFAVHGVLDFGNDISHPGAFAKTIAEQGRRVRVLDMHNTDSVMRAIGKPVELREVSRQELPMELLSKYPEATGGVYAKTQFLMDTPEGRGAFIRIKEGAIDEWSYGYDALDIDYSKVADKDGKVSTVRNLRTVKLYEYGPVLWGMNPSTTTVSAKAKEPSEAKPYGAVHEGEEWCVYRLDEDGEPTGDPLGRHETEEEAQEQVRALYANEDKSEAGPDAFKFTGSPRNPYGTHASRGYPGGRSAWKRAWRIHLSGIRDQGPIQGTVRRVAMIAAGMKPVCDLPEMSAEDAGPRSGACGKLEGDYKETPGDYGLSQWKDPADDNLTREGVQLTCQDLEDLKRICLQEIAKRHACAEEEEGKSNPPGENKGLFTKPELRQAAVEYLQSTGAIGEEFTEEELRQAAADALRNGAGADKAINLSQQVEDVRQAFQAQYNTPHERWYYWIHTVYDEYAIVSYEGEDGCQYFQVSYTRSEEEITFAPRAEWIEGEYEFIPRASQPADKSAKAGRVLSLRNANRMRQALEAMMEIMREAEMMDEEEEDEESSEKADTPGNDQADTSKQAGPPAEDTPTSTDGEAGPEDEAKAPENLLLLIEIEEQEIALMEV